MAKNSKQFIDFLNNIGDKEFYELFNNLYSSFFNEEDENKKENNKECKKEDDAKPKSYFHSVADKYDNGVHTYHSEKEVKDGKVLIDQTMSTENKSLNAKDCEESAQSCKPCNCTEEKKNERLIAKIAELEALNAELRNEMKKMSNINYDLKNQIRAYETKFQKIADYVKF